MLTFQCIYCKKEFPTVKPSVSDIIPYAFIGENKLLLKNCVCECCNQLVNIIAEQSIIRSFESLRRRINATKRRGNSLSNKYILKYKNDTIELETNPIKSDDPNLLLEKPLHYHDTDGRGVIMGPYDKVKEMASKKRTDAKIDRLNVEDPQIEIFETYSAPIGSFFSTEMKTMVAKVCYEWLISVCPGLNPLSKDYETISNAIYTNSVNEKNLVDVMTNTNIAKALFEDISHLKDKQTTEFVPQKLLVGDYYLFFEIKDQMLYCYFAFLGMILYRVLITTVNLPNINNLLVSEIHKYKGRTGQHEIWKVNQSTWSKLSFHLSNQKNYNCVENYTSYLNTKIQELIQFRIEE
jgi:hypothetical protein